jgi:hypothetical protein
MAINPAKDLFSKETAAMRRPKLQEKLRCWSCGLYQTEIEVCLTCEKCNSWILGYLSKDNGRKPVKLSSSRIKPEYEDA